MMITWTYDLLAWSAVLLIALLICCFWCRSRTGIIGIIVGFLGLWLLIAQVKITKVEDKTTTEVSSILDFLASDDASRTDTVLLKGLNHEVEDLALLDSFVVIPLDLDSISFGFTSIHFPREVVEGDLLKVNGSILRTDDGSKVYLTGLDGEEIPGILEESGNFEFKFSSPSPGLYEYQLKIENGVDTVINTIPIKVSKSKKLTLLIYAERPQFELNYLKNYWVSKGHGIVQKVRISKDKYNTSAINSKLMNFANITDAVLKPFDILLFDIEGWNSLSASERRRIKRSVSEDGLGLILLPSNGNERAADLPSHKIGTLSLAELAETDLKTIRLRGSSEWKQFGQGYDYRLGFGNVLIPSWAETFQLILNDKGGVYERLWSTIFSKEFKDFRNDFEISSPFLVVEGQKTELALINVGQDDEIRHNDKEIALENIPYLRDFASIYLTPDQGWNKLIRISDQEEEWVYAYSQEDWKTLSQIRLQNQIHRLSSKSSTTVSPSYVKVSALPWWIPLSLFITGFGFVWLLEKLT